MCWKSLGLPEIFCQPVSGFPVKGRVLLSVRFLFFFKSPFDKLPIGFLATYRAKLIFFYYSFQQKKNITSEIFLLSFFPAVAFTLDIQPTLQVLI